MKCSYIMVLFICLMYFVFVLVINLCGCLNSTFNFYFLGYGGLSLSIEGPSKVDINTEDQEDGTCKVTYCPTEPGNYIINIKFADQHVPGIYCWSPVLD